MTHDRHSARDKRPDTIDGAVNDSGHSHGASSLSAEADGNRTRQGTFAPSSVLKTEGPTRHPDASRQDATRPGVV
jgi:hypothetical protein